MVIPRRVFTLTLLTGLASSRMLHAQSAKRVARVGFLAPGGPGIDSLGASVETFRQALGELGWVDGQNLVIDVRYAEGRYDRLPDLAAELVALKPDVIFAGAANSAQAAKRATTTIPIVMETLGDAMSTGLVTNLARPGGNITGVSGFAPELSAKRLELLREILPSAARVALLANLSNLGSPVIIRATESAARQMRVQIHVVDVRRPTELDNAFDTMDRQRSEALVVVADPMIFGERRRIIELAARHRLPAVYEVRFFADDGGLLSYGPSSVERFQRAAVYVDRILKGAKPGDLPIERPSTFELVVNLKTAKALGIKILPAFLRRADHVIE
jgi:putative ABC transport system substrate-binding protein